MTAQLFYVPFDPIFTSRGLPAGGAKVFFYFTGTTTLAPIYTEASLTSRSVNPVPADALGRIPALYLDSTITYRVRTVDALGAPLGNDYDPYVPGNERAGPPGPPGSVAGFSTAYATRTTPGTWLEATQSGGEVSVAHYINKVVGFSNIPAFPDDLTAGWGFNIKGGSRIDPTKHSWAHAIEYRYKNPGDPSVNGYVEDHGEILFVNASTPGGPSRRVWSHYIPIVKGDGVQRTTYEQTVITWAEYDSRAQKVQWDFRPGFGFLTHAAGLYFAFEGNNSVVGRQANADGSAQIPLPFINNRNEETHSAAQNYSGPVTANLFGAKAYETYNIDGAVANMIARDVRFSSSVTGDATAEQVTLDCSGILDRALFNPDSGGAARETLRTQGGDAYSSFQVQGKEMSAGVDASDNSFVVAQGPNLDTPLFKINRTTGIVSIPLFTNTTFANDAAAAAGGVPINGLYNSGGAVRARAA